MEGRAVKIARMDQRGELRVMLGRDIGEGLDQDPALGRFENEKVLGGLNQADPAASMP